MGCSLCLVPNGSMIMLSGIELMGSVNDITMINAMLIQKSG